MAHSPLLFPLCSRSCSVALGLLSTDVPRNSEWQHTLDFGVRPSCPHSLSAVGAGNSDLSVEWIYPNSPAAVVIQTTAQLCCVQKKYGKDSLPLPKDPQTLPGHGGCRLVSVDAIRPLGHFGSIMKWCLNSERLSFLFFVLTKRHFFPLAYAYCQRVVSRWDP